MQIKFHNCFFNSFSPPPLYVNFQPYMLLHRSHFTY